MISKLVKISIAFVFVGFPLSSMAGSEREYLLLQRLVERKAEQARIRQIEGEQPEQRSISFEMGESKNSKSPNLDGKNGNSL